MQREILYKNKPATIRAEITRRNPTLDNRGIIQPGENAEQDNQTVKEFLESMPQDRRDELISFICGPRKHSWARMREIIPS